MILQKLSLINFKNIPQLTFEFDRGINAMVGDNGAGKTNILDSIYYLSMCKSMFTLTDSQSVKHGTNFFVIDGLYLNDSERSDSVVCTFSKERTHTKVLKRNAKEYDRLSDHLGMIPVVVVMPQDTVLITDSAEERRRLLNASLSQMDRAYLQALIRYNSLLKERNKALKISSNESMLAIYDEQMAVYASQIYEARRNLCEQLTPLVEEFYRLLSHEKESISISYRSELDEFDFVTLMQNSRRRDIANEFTTSGVHRDDLVFSIEGYPLRKYGSQGQQKSFLVALKLAHYIMLCRTLNERPILLLDDLFDKLDSTRVERLMEIVSNEEFGQIFISDCNRTRLERILGDINVPFRLFEMEAGEVVNTKDYEAY